eukprot:768664-Hanusia_phi.AAC.3
MKRRDMAACGEVKALRSHKSSSLDSTAVKDRLVRGVHAKTISTESNAGILEKNGEPKEVPRKTKETCTMMDLCTQDKETIACVLRQILQLTEINEATLRDLQTEREAKSVLLQENADLKEKNSSLELKLEQAIDLLRQYQIRMKSLYEGLQKTEQELELVKSRNGKNGQDINIELCVESNHDRKEDFVHHGAYFVTESGNLHEASKEEIEEEIPSPNHAVPSPHLPNTIDQAISEFAKALSSKYGALSPGSPSDEQLEIPIVAKSDECNIISFRKLEPQIPSNNFSDVTKNTPGIESNTVRAWMESSHSFETELKLPATTTESVCCSSSPGEEKEIHMDVLLKKEGSDDIRNCFQCATPSLNALNSLDNATPYVCAVQDLDNRQKFIGNISEKCLYQSFTDHQQGGCCYGKVDTVACLLFEAQEKNKPGVLSCLDRGELEQFDQFPRPLGDACSYQVHTETDSKSSEKANLMNEFMETQRSLFTNSLVTHRDQGHESKANDRTSVHTHEGPRTTAQEAEQTIQADQAEGVESVQGKAEDSNGAAVHTHEGPRTTATEPVKDLTSPNVNSLHDDGVGPYSCGPRREGMLEVDTTLQTLQPIDWNKEYTASNGFDVNQCLETGFKTGPSVNRTNHIPGTSTGSLIQKFSYGMKSRKSERDQISNLHETSKTIFKRKSAQSQSDAMIEQQQSYNSAYPLKNQEGLMDWELRAHSAASDAKPQVQDHKLIGVNAQLLEDSVNVESIIQPEQQEALNGCKDMYDDLFFELVDFIDSVDTFSVRGQKKTWRDQPCASWIQTQQTDWGEAANYHTTNSGNKDFKDRAQKSLILDQLAIRLQNRREVNDSPSCADNHSWNEDARKPLASHNRNASLATRISARGWQHSDVE